MHDPPYADDADDELILRDHLAIDRTKLANERTLMAYARTALAMVVVGLASFEFAEATWIHAFGCAFILLGVVVFAWGIVRFRKFQRDILERTGGRREE